MNETPNLNIPYLIAAQAQKHVTHNEALRALDAVVQLAVVERDLTAPPGSPTDGDRYIVGASATGDWAGQDSKIAAYQDNAWMFYTPLEGWLAWIADEDILFAYNGTSWVAIEGSAVSLNPAIGNLVGVNTTADATNKLAVKSDAVLHSHDDVTPGNGSVQHKLNKAASGNTASFLFQNNWSGRSEIGLTGDDDFHFKVSPDGANWFEGLILDRDTGIASFPHSPGLAGENLLINGDFQINQRNFSGGNLTSGSYGFDRWKAGTSNCDVSLFDSTVTLTSGPLVQIIESPGINGQWITLSVEDLSGGDLDIYVGGQTGTIISGSGRRGKTLLIGAGQTGDIEVRLTPASGAVSFKRVKLEYGVFATAWKNRQVAVEHMLCSRYFQTVEYRQYDTIGAGRVNWDGTVHINYQYVQTMRASPSVTLSGSTGDAFEVVTSGTTTNTAFLSVTLQNTTRMRINLAAIANDNNSVCYVRRRGGSGYKDSSTFKLDAEL